MIEEDNDIDINVDLFEEPSEFYKSPPKPTFITYERQSQTQTQTQTQTESQIQLQPSSIEIRLVGNSPLYGHILSNAGRSTAKYLDTEIIANELYKDKNVLEVGAAGALPSLITILNGAKKIVITDYPDPDLIENIKYNVNNLKTIGINNDILKKVSINGYIWGNETNKLSNFINNEKFDLIILSDVIFNHTEHYKLLNTCKSLILNDNDKDKRKGKVYVTFSPHRPKLFKNDLLFFEIAEKEFNFKSIKIYEEKWSPLFKDDKDESTKELRSMVYGYYLIPNW